MKLRRRGLAIVLLVLGTGCLVKEGGPTAPPTQSSTTDRGVTVVETTSKLGVPLVILPGGKFTMGNAQGAEDERPPHEVEVRSFAIDKYEFTQDLLAKLETPNPSHFKGDRRPAEQIRWTDAALICNARSRAENLQPCYDEATFACNFEANGYRLPTEAEWEYAARAGSEQAEPLETSLPDLDGQACYAGNSGQQTDVVGKKKANAWGLHDMRGNVAEWCHDVYEADYYAKSPSTDPRGPDAGEKRVLRGGAWNADPAACRLTARQSDDSGISDACFARDTHGFRCVRKP